MVEIVESSKALILKILYFFLSTQILNLYLQSFFDYQKNCYKYLKILKELGPNKRLNRILFTLKKLVSFFSHSERIYK